LSCRPDWKLEGTTKPGSSLEAMQSHVLDRYQPRFGILNCLYGAQVMHSEDMAAVFCRATNDWIRAKRTLGKCGVTVSDGPR
jgi:hypothetical protein